MINIWGFLVQTIEVSLIAVVLLILKRLFQDKLSPRWQYGVWIVFLFSLLIPTGLLAYTLFPSLRVFIEAIKTIVEKMWQSSYTDIYLPIQNYTFFPLIKDIPSSVTDVLFVVYVCGVIFWIGRYLIQYFQLKKLILQYGQKSSNHLMTQIEQVIKQYHFSPCQAIVLEGIPSAFVFGIFKPVLVLPSQTLLDDKIILHELLHLKYKDSFHCVMWSCLRCLHWCNPFLQYVFDQINNDMESLCDQRVLERLEGVQRREYGKILLQMTNEKYPHAFGTTSLSNGAQNIKKRIEAIARFKKYPQGMAIVSVCICVLLAPLSIGYFHSYSLIGNPYEYDNFSYQLSLASARIVEYPTVAGAIDAYAKGILSNDEQFLLSVMPQKYYVNYQTVLSQRPDGIVSNQPGYLYDVTHLEKISKDEYQAKLCFYDKSDHFDVENERVIAHYTIIPIQIIKERGWKVQQIGDILKGDANYIQTFMNSEVYEIPIYQTMSFPYHDGQINMTIRNGYQVNNIDSVDDMPSYHAYELNPRAQFNSGYQYIEVTYENEEFYTSQEKNKYIYMCIQNLDDMDDKVEFPPFDDTEYHYGRSGGSSNEESHVLIGSESLKYEEEMTLQHISAYDDTYKINLPGAYALQIIINGKKEIIKINVEDGEWYETNEFISYY